MINAYYPQVAEALGIFIDTLFHKYIAILVNNNKFDLSAVSSYDIEHSTNLLQNISLTENKESVIREAFETCPYNIKVYTIAIKNDIVDEKMLEIANIFDVNKELVDALNEYCLLHKLNEAKFNNIKNIVSMFAIYYEKNINEIYESIYQKEIKKIRNLYFYFLKVTDKRYEYIKWIKTNIANNSSDFIKLSDEQIKKDISEIVTKSIFPETFNYLFNNNILTKENILPNETGNNTIEVCILNLISKLTYNILEYKKETDQRVAKGILKLENLKKQYEEIKNIFDSSNREFDKLIEELKTQRNTLGFFAFTKKKEIDQKLKKITIEKDNNPARDKYMKYKKEYEEYFEQLEKLT